ncbi:MAG: phenylalanine--tRNA ligase subunit alpha [Bacilli bacterium]
MKERVELLKHEFEEREIKSLEDLEKLRIEYLGKKGIITGLLTELSLLNNEEKKDAGKEINEFKVYVTSFISSLQEEMKRKELSLLLEKESIDVTLPGTSISSGSPHIIEKIIEEFEEYFISLGFNVVEGPEVESDLYNFEMLNLPVGHPARDAQDTFYITPNMLLRSQTSPVQVRTMLSNVEKGPLRIICPGKTYRRDNDDATHSHQFTQIEGLLIGEDISLSDLKGIVTSLMKKIFGDKVESRFRPSFYPFTEPSVEVDISCFNCNSNGCDICKHTGWITVAGAGMVHPSVLKGCGYDTEKYTGFAFGFGAERLAMLKYGINDVRILYSNDLRTSSDFNKRRD